MFSKHTLSHGKCYTHVVQDEGNLSWIDGSPVNFTFWNGAGRRKGCVRMRRNVTFNGRWIIGNCSRKREFLCRESKSFFCVYGVVTWTVFSMFQHLVAMIFMTQRRFECP